MPFSLQKTASSWSFCSQVFCLHFHSYHLIFTNWQLNFAKIESNIFTVLFPGVWSPVNLRKHYYKASGGDEFQLSNFKSYKVMLLKCHIQYASKTQQQPQDWKRSIFISILKKGNDKECSNRHTIALISCTSKVMLKIL